MDLKRSGVRSLDRRAAWQIEMCMTLFAGSCSVQSQFRV
jgi:hypothetical protein